jgi:aminotransferase
MDFEQAVPQHRREWMTMRQRQRGLAALAAQYSNVVELGYGDVGFVTPEHICKAAKDAIDAGHTRYDYLKALREAIAAKLWRDNQITADPEREIIVSAGCHAILFQLFASFVGPGDEVIVGSPGSYYYGNTAFQGGTPVEVPLRETRRFRMDPDEIAAAITPRTKIIALTTPDGPVGAVHLRSDLERIAELAQRHNLLVISDEIYEKINYGETPHFSIASLPGMRERTITVNGFSKGYAMTGWRVGYAVVPAYLMPAMSAVNALNMIWLNTIAQYAAVAAYEGPQEPAAEMVEEYRRKMHILVQEINSIAGLQCQFPDATYYAWVKITALGLSAEDFGRHLLFSERVLVQPGTVFGQGGEGYIRTSCSAPEPEMREGLRRLRRAVERLHADGPVLTPVA